MLTKLQGSQTLAAMLHDVGKVLDTYKITRFQNYENADYSQYSVLDTYKITRFQNHNPLKSIYLSVLVTYKIIRFLKQVRPNVGGWGCSY